MSNLETRVSRLETKMTQQADTVGYPPFSHDVITALLEGRAPEGQMRQKQSVFNFGAVERMLKLRGEHDA